MDQTTADRAHELETALAALLPPFTTNELEKLFSNDHHSPQPIKNVLSDMSDRWPKSWLDFFSWSNGGIFLSGAREFGSILTIGEVRDYLVTCGMLLELPGAIPFAMDGSGSFYLFDVRRPPVEGEYPVVFGHHTDLSWNRVVSLEPSFFECCSALARPELLE